MTPIDLSSAKIIDRLPDSFDSGRGDEVPSDLAGATILCVGTVDADLEGGGLAIEYRPPGSDERRRVVFAFNELGMWVAFSGAAQSEPPSQA